MKNFGQKNIVDFDVIHEASDSETYYGFKNAVIGQGNATTALQEASANWAIMKEVITTDAVNGDITRRFWANGTKAKNLIWNLRDTYTYKF